MSKFTDIQKMVSKRIEDEKAYWDPIYEVFVSIHSKYREYLGLTSESVKNSRGEQTAILLTGYYNVKENKVVPAAPFVLEKDGLKLCFDIGLNLCASNSQDIVFAVYFKVKLSEDDGAFLFEISGLNDLVVCKESDSQLDLTPFFDALQRLLLEKLKFKKE